MSMYFFRTIYTFAAMIAVSVAMVLFAGPAWAVVVDCNSGGSIQTELNNGETQIDFSGTCNEFVSVFQDGTRITGASPATSIITGGMSINGVTRVRIENLTVDGGSGVFISDGAAARVNGSTFQAGEFGFIINRNSSARLDGNTIGPASGTTSSSCAALCVGENSNLRMTNTTVTANASNPAVGGPLILFRNSTATLRGGNVITNTGTEAAVGIFNHSYLRQDDPTIPDGGTSNGVDTFTGSQRALDVFAMSQADIRNAVVNGNTRVTLHSLLRIASKNFGSDPNNIVFNGKVKLRQDSGLRIDSPLVTMNGNIRCKDKTSNAQGEFQGTGKYKNCTDFDGEPSIPGGSF
ncbi:MAG: hypothetical protein AB3N20_01065 [Rhizobiaceae bacterium]